MESTPLPNLFLLIELTNLFPRKKVLPDVDLVKSEVYNNPDIADKIRKKSKDNDLEFLKAIFKLISKRTKSCPKLFQQVTKLMDKIKGKDKELKDFEGLYCNYRDFFTAREIIWYYAKGEGAKLRAPYHVGLKIPPKFNSKSIVKMNSLLIMKDHYIHSNGLFYSFEDEYIEPALVNINLEQMRICSACNLVFWANRSNKIYCSDRCSAVNRSQRKREKDAEKIARFVSRKS